MARQPRQLMRQGVADLPTRAHVDAYIGPTGEMISDGETLRLQDGATAGGIPIVSLKSKILSSFTGAIPRLLADLLFAQCHAVIWGVEAGSAESQTEKMRKAIAWAQSRGADLILPEGVITLGAPDNDADAVLRITKLMSMRGTRATCFDILPSVGTRHIILVKPAALGGGIRGMVLRDFQIGKTLGQIRPGGDGIRIDTSAKFGFVAKLLVENVSVTDAGIGKYSFFHYNEYTVDGGGNHLTGNPTGGMFASTIRDCDFFGGMKFVETGDSNNVERCILTGPNEGFYYWAIARGAATHRLHGCNITATGDPVYVKGSIQVSITENQIEAVGSYTGSLANPACITFDGTGGYEVKGNNMHGYDRCDCVAAINGAKGRVWPNYATYAADKNLFRAVAAPGNIVDRQLTETCGGASVVGASRVSLDAASITLGVWQKLTLLNGWLDADNTNFRQGLWWMPLPDGTVRLSGSVKPGTTTPGTAIVNFPAGYRVTGKAARLFVAGNSNGVFGFYPTVLNLAGDLTTEATAPNQFYQFDGMSFSNRPQ